MGFRFANPFLITLQTYDAAHQTAYLETLRTYLAKERSLVRTAQALHIHVNTLKYRLKRIQDLGCPDLENDRIRQQLTLTFFFDL